MQQQFDSRGSDMPLGLLESIGREEQRKLAPTHRRARLKNLIGSLRRASKGHRIISTVEDRARHVGSVTAKHRIQVCERILTIIFERGYELCSVDRLCWKHIQAWLEEAIPRYKVSTLQVQITHLRWLLLVLKKHELRTRLDEYLASTGITSRAASKPADLAVPEQARSLK